MEIGKKLADALGVEAEAPEAVQDPEPEVETPEEVTEEPEEIETEEVETEEATEQKEAEEEQGEPDKGMTAEQRRENAARRRKAEQDAAVSEAVKQARAQWDAEAAEKRKEWYRRAGLKNNFTGEVITSDEEFDKWESENKQRRFNQSLKKGELTQEQLTDLIENNPKVKAASEIVRREEEQRQERAKQAAQESLAREIQKIHEMDESINSKDDLFTMENSKEFYEMCMKNPNMLISDVFKLVNHDRLAKAAAEAGKKAAMSNIRGKDHLNSMGKARGTGSESVTAKELKMYRIFNPNVTAAEIAEFKNKNK